MAMTQKQKVLIPLIIIAFAYVLWQLYDLFGIQWLIGRHHAANNTKHFLVADKSHSEIPFNELANQNTDQQELFHINHTTKAVSSNAQPLNLQPLKAKQKEQISKPGNLTEKQIAQLVAPAEKQAVTLAKKPSAQPLATNNQQKIIQPQASSFTENTSAVSQPTQPSLTPEQLEYLRLANQYQLLKMQRMVLDEQAAIASAKEKIAQTDTNTMQYGGDSSTSAIDNLQAADSSTYKLMYIDFQHGQWTATLSKMGQYFEVTPGTLLLDGTRVLQITQQGVVLQEDNQKVFLNFFGTRTLANDAENSAIPAATNVNSQPVTESQKPTNHSNNPKSSNQMQSSANLESAKSETASTREIITNSVTANQEKLATDLSADEAEVKLTPQQLATYEKIKTLHQNQLAANNPNENENSDKALLAMPSHNFTIQLRTGTNKADLEEYIKQYHLQNAYILTLEKHRKPWYVLVYGNYSDIVQAATAIRELPRSVQKDLPWIRPIANIQATLEANEAKTA